AVHARPGEAARREPGAAGAAARHPAGHGERPRQRALRQATGAGPAVRADRAVPGRGAEGPGGIGTAELPPAAGGDAGVRDVAGGGGAGRACVAAAAGVGGAAGTGEPDEHGGAGGELLPGAEARGEPRRGAAAIEGVGAAGAAVVNVTA